MGEFSNEHSITRTNLVTRVNIRKPVGNESEYWEENETCSLSPIITVQYTQPYTSLEREVSRYLHTADRWNASIQKKEERDQNQCTLWRN